jgi:hypothetical protein
MAEVTMCDQCRAIGGNPPLGWYVLVTIGTGESYSSWAGADVIANQRAGVFCSAKCVAEYATARALLESAE